MRMKTWVTLIVISLFSFTVSQSFSLTTNQSFTFAEGQGADTIDQWEVKRNGKVIMKGTPGIGSMRMNLTKGTIIEKDMMEIFYFTDAPCVNCQPFIVIQNENGEELDRIQALGDAYRFKFKTKRLQASSHQNRSGILMVYFSDGQIENKQVKLFEVAVK